MSHGRFHTRSPCSPNRLFLSPVILWMETLLQLKSKQSDAFGRVGVLMLFLGFCNLVECIPQITCQFIDLLQKATSQANVKTSLFGRSKLDQMLLHPCSFADTSIQIDANQQHAKACEGKLRQSRKAKHAGQFRVVPLN